VDADPEAAAVELAALESAGTVTRVPAGRDGIWRAAG
jgi:hypothetical protein